MFGAFPALKVCSSWSLIIPSVTDMKFGMLRPLSITARCCSGDNCAAISLISDVRYTFFEKEGLLSRDVVLKDLLSIFFGWST